MFRFCFRYFFFALTFSVFLILGGCGSLRKTKGIKTTKSMTLEKFWAAQAADSPNFQTAAMRAQIRYTNEEKTQQVTTNFRIRNGHTVWANASFVIPLAKVLVTRDRVQFYEKINRQFYDGDPSLLESFLGVSLGVEALQAMLMGQPLLKGVKNDFKLRIEKQQYTLTASQKLGGGVFEMVFDSSFKLVEQRWRKENEVLKIHYQDHQIQEGKNVPMQLVIDIIRPGNLAKIDIQFKNYSFDRALSFPFEIPKNYDEIAL